MKDSSKMLSIIAFFLSEYDMQAVASLGYKNRVEAIREISAMYDRNSNYLKLRRDEFDALPLSSSHRNGWNKRKPTKDVLELGKSLSQRSFEELLNLITALLNNQKSADNQDISTMVKNVPVLRTIVVTDESDDNDDIEQIINATDDSASLEVVFSSQNRRVLNTSIIHNLKKLYQGICQICGYRPFEDESVDINEAHHIEYFSKSQNNKASNIIIVCPNHHRMIHKCNPTFDNNNLSFLYADGRVERLKVNYHL